MAIINAGSGSPGSPASDQSARHPPQAHERTEVHRDDEHGAEQPHLGHERRVARERIRDRSRSLLDPAFSICGSTYFSETSVEYTRPPVSDVAYPPDDVRPGRAVGLGEGLPRTAGVRSGPGADRDRRRDVGVHVEDVTERRLRALRRNPSAIRRRS